MTRTNVFDGPACLAHLPVSQPLSEPERAFISGIVRAGLSSGSYGACVEPGQYRLTADPDGLCRFDMTGCTVDFLPYNIERLPLRSVTFPVETVTNAWSVLKRISSLETVNGIPADEFIAAHEDKMAEQ